MHGVNNFRNYFYSNKLYRAFYFGSWRSTQSTHLKKIYELACNSKYLFICLLYFIVGREFSTGSGKRKSERTVWKMSWWGKVAKKGCSYLVLQWNEWKQISPLIQGWHCSAIFWYYLSLCNSKNMCLSVINTPWPLL